jgi:hypothetical protein
VCGLYISFFCLASVLELVLVCIYVSVVDNKELCSSSPFLLRPVVTVIGNESGLGLYCKSSNYIYRVIVQFTYQLLNKYVHKL